MAPRRLHSMEISQNNKPIFFYRKNMKTLKLLLLSVSLLASNSFAYADDEEPRDPIESILTITDIIVGETTIQVTPLLMSDDYKVANVGYYLDLDNIEVYETLVSELQTFTFTGLTKNTTYTVWIYVDFENGDWTYYGENVTTAAGLPDVSMKVTELKVGKNTIELAYEVSNMPDGAYSFKFYKDDELTGETEDFSYTYTNLNPATEYSIKVEAQDSNAQVLCSWEQDITTSEGVYTVFFDNTEAEWSSVNLYAWIDNNHKNADWPGVALSQLNEGSNIWVGHVSEDFPNIIFNNGNSGQDNQTTDLTGVAGKTYHKDSKTNVKVSIAGAFNGWDTNANYSYDVNENIATVIVPYYNNKDNGFKVVVNNDTWYGGKSNPSIGSWFGDMGDNNMRLKTEDGSENYEGGVKFTVDYTNGHFLAEECSNEAHHIEWLGLERDSSTGEYTLDLYTDKLTSPIKAYVCNFDGERLPRYDVTFEITEEEPNGIGTLFINSDNVIDARGLVPDGEEGAKYEFTLYATAYTPAVLYSPKQHRATMGIADNAIKVHFNNSNTPTAIETITADSAASADGPIRWYNLSGLEIPAPTAGSVCIKVQGTKAQKVLIR